MGFLRHQFCPADRFWVWDPRGWRCSHCRYLVRADGRDQRWLELARYHRADRWIDVNGVTIDLEVSRPVLPSADAGDFSSELDKPKYDRLP